MYSLAARSIVCRLSEDKSKLTEYLRKIKRFGRRCSDDLRISVEEGGARATTLRSHTALLTIDFKFRILDKGDTTKECRQIIECHLVIKLFLNRCPSKNVPVNRDRRDLVARFNNNRLRMLMLLKVLQKIKCSRRKLVCYNRG